MVYKFGWVICRGVVICCRLNIPARIDKQIESGQSEAVIGAFSLVPDH